MFYLKMRYPSQLKYPDSMHKDIQENYLSVEILFMMPIDAVSLVITYISNVMFFW